MTGYLRALFASLVALAFLHDPSFGAATRYQFTGMINPYSSALEQVYVGPGFRGSFEYIREEAAVVDYDASIPSQTYWGGIKNFRIELDMATSAYMFEAPPVQFNPQLGNAITPTNGLWLTDDRFYVAGQVADSVQVYHRNQFNYANDSFAAYVPEEMELVGYTPLELSITWEGHGAAGDAIFFDSLDPPVRLDESFAKAASTDFEMLFFHRYASPAGNPPQVMTLTGDLTSLVSVPEPPGTCFVAACGGLAALRRKRVDVRQQRLL